MGVFHDMVEIVNRTDEQLMLTFDGQRMYLPPNYDKSGKRLEGVHTMIPRQCVPYALNQNVNMGTEDSYDPSTFESLVGIADPKEKRPKSWNTVTYIPAEERNKSLTRVNLKEFLEDDPQVKDIVVRGRRMSEVRPEGDKRVIESRVR